jgi:hypothetical protein
MTIAEVPFRVAQAVKARTERWLVAGNADAPAPDLRRTGSPWIRASREISPAPYFAAAERIVAGKVAVFALQDIELGTPPRWNTDPKTGTQAPLDFGMLLDYRDTSLVGDVKYLWELNRHGHLVTLAQAYALGGEPRYAQTIQDHLESWFEACPCGMGPNWSSALEPAIRLINWSAVWHLLGGANAALFATPSGVRFRDRWLASVYQHARFVRGHLSRHSSANNHLIGEAAGLYVAARTWPCWARTGQWLQQAAAILEHEAMLQNAADGVNREQAVAYQQFELDLLLAALLAAQADGASFSREVLARIELMLDYFVSIMDAGGNVPKFGDSDDGFVARLSQESNFCAYRSLLSTGAVLFERADFVAKAGPCDDKTKWLLGERATRLEPTATLPTPRTQFADGGYYILGCDFDSAEEVRLIADAGPLGYGMLAAHGHADALAFTLSVGGREFLVDPGTYTYRYDTPWRAYFRGTSAHNTVRIDGQDQSLQGGNFMWLQKAHAECRHWHSSSLRDEFEGVHYGYRRLADPVVHRRQIALDKPTRRIVIDDILEMSGTHDVELFFHCSPDCHVENGPKGHALTQGARTVWLQLPQALRRSVRICRGENDPICGWTSPRFDVIEPSCTIVWSARLSGSTTLRTVISC